MTATVVVGLAFGDEGKGTVVDHLARRSPEATVVRYCGGPQAAHNVITPDGRHHTFAQFGSGMFVPTTRTHLSRYMMVNPLNMVSEAQHLEQVGVIDPWRRTTVDPGAQVVTPYHRGLNRLRELSRGADRHGSCGQGVGEAAADLINRGDECLFFGDIASPTVLVHKLTALWEIARREATRLCIGADMGDPVRLGAFRDCHADPAVLAEVYGRIWPDVNVAGDGELGGDLIFEGAQGVLLDEDRGFAPYNTWSTTTTENAFRILEHCSYIRRHPSSSVEVIGVLRSYMTRHGPGPFETEDPDLKVPEPHNAHGDWQGAWRQGWLDVPLLRYALDCCSGVSGLAMTHVDSVPREGWPVRVHERPAPYPVFAKDGYAERVAAALGVRLAITSHGPTAEDKLTHDRALA